VISVAFKTPLKIRLGICINKTSHQHRPDEYVDFTPSCPPTFCNKIAPMVVGKHFLRRVIFKTLLLPGAAYITSIIALKTLTKTVHIS